MAGTEIGHQAAYDRKVEKAHKRMRNLQIQDADFNVMTVWKVRDS